MTEQGGSKSGSKVKVDPTYFYWCKLLFHINVEWSGWDSVITESSHSCNFALCNRYKNPLPSPCLSMLILKRMETRGERERLFGSREREGKLKITFPLYGKGTGICKLLREGKGNLRLVIPGIPGNPGNQIKSKIKFKIIFMPWQAIRSQSRYFFNQCKYDICNRFTRSVIPQYTRQLVCPFPLQIVESTMSKKHEFLPELINW